MSIYSKNIVRYIIVGSMLAITLLSSCFSSKRNSGTSEVKDLFMQTKRVNIQIPDKGVGAAVVSEVVTFKNYGYTPLDGEVAFREGQNKLDTSTVYRLSEVEVRAQSRFAAERDGRVSVDFKIVVPKETLSENWRLLLNPKLIHNDSIVPLQKVMLNGKSFVAKQKEDYANFKEYMSSIVDESKYDSAYIDIESIEKDISDRQGKYYGNYHKEWKLQKDYEDWRTNFKKEELYRDAIKSRYLKETYHEYSRKAIDHKVRNMLANKDTAGLHAEYMKKYDKKAKKHIRQFMDDFNADGSTDSARMAAELELRFVPKKFKKIHQNGRTMGGVNNFVFTAEDSIEISKHRYFFDEIVLNETKLANRDFVFTEMVSFPHEEDKSMIRLDTVIPSNRNFEFYYTQDYPVVAGMKSLRIAMDSKVQAIDKSEYKLQSADTLSFFIASLAQLADTSLIFKRTKLHRNMYDRIAVYSDYRSNKAAYEVGYKKNKAGIDKFLEAFRKYNNSPDFTVDSVTMISTTSLDGNYDENYDMTLSRANSVKSYLKSTLSGEANVDNLFRITRKGEDWDALASHIKKNQDILNSEDILYMLTNAVYPDQCEADIKKQFPSDYKIIQESIYPLMRKIDFVIDIHRTGLESDTLKVEYRADYEKGLQLLQDREYWDALEILANYPDYNTALCMVCLGYNERAEKLLEQLPQSGQTEYLMAIVATRTNRDSKAVQHLLTACKLDSSKVYRIPLDPEMSKLVSTYNLYDRLESR